MNTEDKNKWKDLSEGLIRAAEEFKEDEYEDQRPLTMVQTCFKILSYLVSDYEEGNREMTQLFAELIMDYIQELQQYQQKKDFNVQKFEELLEGVDLNRNYP